MIAAALDEAMALLLHGQGTYALTGRLEVELKAPAAVGSFLEVEADVTAVDGRRLSLEAGATGDDGTVALARGTFVEVARRGPPGRTGAAAVRRRAGQRERCSADGAAGR